MHNRGPSPSQSPCEGGSQSAVMGGAGGFSKDLTDGGGVAFIVVAAR